MLRRAAKSVQKIAEAIAATANCNVTIIDSNLVRIAGTGPYQEKIKDYTPEGSAFIKVLQNKKTIVIEEPGEEQTCFDCSERNHCIETYEICSPIIWNGEVMGVIGICAFDEEQKRYLQERKEQFLNFLGKMSQLLASKVGEIILFEEIETRNRELDAVIQNVNQGVICIDAQGRITHINEKAIDLLDLNHCIHDIKNTSINSIWDNPLILKAIEDRTDYFDQEEYYERQGYKKGFLTTAKIIYKEGNIAGVVSTFTDLDNIQKSAFRLREKNTDFTFNTLIGVSDALMQVKNRAIKVANFDSTVLIVGESGTGKEVFARAIHNASPRAEYPFVSINCSAIPESLLESELFGYEPGAFTGANKKGKIGKMELANKGTFFLDEIGDMPLFLQAKLLRVLQEKRVTKIGGLKSQKLDIRIIAATNKNLEELIEKRMFREDLYYRLNVIPLSLPSLDKRPEDVLVLAEYFLRLYNKRFKKSIKGFTEEAKDFLLKYSWPGNVRELENIIEYGINFAEGELIQLGDIRDRFRAFSYNQTKSLKERVKEYERETIEKYLERYGWSDEGKEKAAKDLGISRATLYRKLSQY
ncbi:sigma 54-interacting transcriptional regulator [Irregularibacter muris]|uniref:Sigma 54-interacting transcriptional regulator n=1 Tax=Irregularibacter muris TaxID=1796619 RepID=A0AAE3HHW8_9FIRM|nr:sigma 54-interacting transcriptional regulator [Irregularibacter muris]MCR1899739.1 sigma 54-interacting transcriptional regulator [Irregularibacter muris]